MDDPALARRQAAAEALAREAGQTMRRRFQDRSSFTISFKGRQDFLTEVDGEIERMTAERLSALFPEDRILGEEGGFRGGAGPGVWVIDPIDGTSNFARGVPHFCISIGYAVDRSPKIGVIYDPMLDELFAARQGAGATLNGAAIRVSDTTSFENTNIEIGWNLRSGMAGFQDLLGKVVDVGAGVTRAGSGALGVAYVAAGRIDGYIEQHINSWDVLAGLVLVSEAGGLVNDFLAGDGLTQGGPILASGPGLADALSRLSRIPLPARG
jgi:myo-inositol-1(or 4)-monophosphatase